MDRELQTLREAALISMGKKEQQNQVKELEALRAAALSSARERRASSAEKRKRRLHSPPSHIRENNTSYDDSYDSDDNNYGRTTPKMSETDERAITPPQFNNNIHNTVFTVKVSDNMVLKRAESPPDPVTPVSPPKPEPPELDQITPPPIEAATEKRDASLERLKLKEVIDEVDETFEALEPILLSENKSPFNIPSPILSKVSSIEGSPVLDSKAKKKRHKKKKSSNTKVRENSPDAQKQAKKAKKVEKNKEYRTTQVLNEDNDKVSDDEEKSKPTKHSIKKDKSLWNALPTPKEIDKNIEHLQKLKKHKHENRSKSNSKSKQKKLLSDMCDLLSDLKESNDKTDKEDDHDRKKKDTHPPSDKSDKSPSQRRKSSPTTKRKTSSSGRNKSPSKHVSPSRRSKSPPPRIKSPSLVKVKSPHKKAKSPLGKTKSPSRRRKSSPERNTSTRNKSPKQRSRSRLKTSSARNKSPPAEKNRSPSWSKNNSSPRRSHTPKESKPESISPSIESNKPVSLKSKRVFEQMKAEMNKHPPVARSKSFEGAQDVVMEDVTKSKGDKLDKREKRHDSKQVKRDNMEVDQEAMLPAEAPPLNSVDKKEEDNTVVNVIRSESTSDSDDGEPLDNTASDKKQLQELKKKKKAKKKKTKDDKKKRKKRRHKSNSEDSSDSQPSKKPKVKIDKSELNKIVQFLKQRDEQQRAIDDIKNTYSPKIISKESKSIEIKLKSQPKR